MAIYGSPDAWIGTFDSALIPNILDLILAAWTKFTKPTSDELEPRITKRFRNQLRRERDIVKLPVRIGREVVEDDLATGEEKGRIDIQFTSPQSCREDVYLAFESKKLNIVHTGEWKSQATEYVKDGMMRFVTGQYATGLTDGGMLGYVMDGKVDKAVQAVNSQIKKQSNTLEMGASGSLGLSSLRPDNELIRETTHFLTDRNFVVHHLFLSA